MWYDISIYHILYTCYIYISLSLATACKNHRPVVNTTTLPKVTIDASKKKKKERKKKKGKKRTVFSHNKQGINV